MRFKTKQLDTYTEGETTINPPASLQPPDGARRAKNLTSEDKQLYMNTLQVQFRRRLRAIITKCNEGNKGFNDLLKTQLQSQRLPRGIVKDAEASIDVVGEPIKNFLCVNYSAKNKKSVDLWKEFVRKNFEAIKTSILNKEDDDDDDEQDSDDESENGFEDDGEFQEDVQYRACSTSFSSTIRKDLSPAIRTALINTINTTLEQVSDYIADFSKQVFKIALLFAENEFVKQDRTLALVPQEGNSLAPLLPVNYLQEDVTVPKPINSDCLKDDTFNSQYRQLFQQGHLGLIHSTYYGSLGVEEGSLKAFPLHQEVMKHLPRDGSGSYESLSSHVMKIARKLYDTNLQVMWSDNTLVNKLLSRLLRFLLLVHLRPDDDGEFKRKKQELKRKNKGEQVLKDTNGSIPLESISLINMTRNGRRRLFRKEEENMEKYLKKGNTRSAELCQMRLNTYREVLEREQQEQPMESDDIEDQLVQDEIKVEKSQDISKRRLNTLIGLTRSALFLKDDIPRPYIEKKLNSASEQEIDTVIRIVQFVKPYIPAKANYRSFAFQLPFLLMANQVLRSIGRESQVVKITPIISPTSLKALLIDTTTLFSLFWSKNVADKMRIYDFSGHLIKSGTALAHKDAVFSSFFDIERLKSVTKSYGLEFANRIHVLPGLKAVRLYGEVTFTRRNTNTSESANAEIDSMEDQDDEETLKELKSRKAASEQLLKDATKELNKCLVENNSVRSEKRQWKENPDDRDMHYRREQLQATKREIYEHRHPASTTASTPIIVNSEEPCLRKVEECMIDESQLDLNQAVFSGTDNGLIKTTETVFFGIDRFIFHLELHNRSQILEDPMDTDDAWESWCRQLPPTLTLGPKEINQQSGLATYTASLAKKKKRTTLGHQVLQSEQFLSECSLHQSANTNELDSNYREHEQCRETIRSLYYSNSQCKKRRRLELSKTKHHDRVAASERKSSNHKKPIMFVGDRGHGVGSRIKGHQKFGGTWKQELHGRYTPTLITNEYNSSQTCLFCFHKLSHPMVAVKDEVKATNGSFVCLNAQCPNAYTVVCRDQVSALAIGLAGLASLLFGVTFPCFDEHPNRVKRDEFNQSALSFLYRKQLQGSPIDDGNTF
ncbi:hypothetical protein PS15p_208349 [Mucor circinelloides]